MKITIVNPDTVESELGDLAGAEALKKAVEAHQIELLTNFRIQSLRENLATTNTGDVIDFNLLMLVPPFRGSSAASHVGITSDEGYVNVDRTMRVIGHERIYAVGDCLNFEGPKMGHMAVRQGEVAALNLAAEIDGVVFGVGRSWCRKGIGKLRIHKFGMCGGNIMSENRTIHLVEVPMSGKGGFVWNRLHGEREDVCEALVKDSVSEDRRELLQSRLRKIDDAVDRLMSGCYGNCSKCGQSIDDTKLDVDPAVALCLECRGREPGLVISGEDKHQVFDAGSNDELVMENLKPFDTILLRTHNSEYRILLLDPKTGRALVDGGDYLDEPSEALLKGSGAPGSSFNTGSICIGCRLEMWVDERVFITSPIRSFEVKHAAAESLPSISEALH